MRIRLFLLFISVFLVFSACEKDEEYSYGKYPYSWLPATNETGEKLKGQYPNGTPLKVIIYFKSFDSNPIETIDVKLAQIDASTGETGTYNSIESFTSSNFTFDEEKLQHYVTLSYTVEDKFIDQKVSVMATFTAKDGTIQDKEIAKFLVVEFEYIVEEMEYYYMYDNVETAAAIGYTVEHSAGYTTLTTVMNYYGFDEENTNFQGELGGNIKAHTPDWVAYYYTTIWPQWLCQDVSELHDTYYYESDYYGGSKLLHSTELGTYSEIDDAIKEGLPVIVHGDFRGDVDFKHQIILVATNDTHFLALDPAGKWDGAKNGSYTKNADVGSYVKYSKENVYNALGEDGKVWMHYPVAPADETLITAKKASSNRNQEFSRK